MKTTLILHLWWSLFKASLIQLNAKAYCMMFDQVVLFCSECCFICWFMYHNKSNWQEKRLRASRGAKDCCNEKQNSERHVSFNQHHRQKQTDCIELCFGTDVYATDTDTRALFCEFILLIHVFLENVWKQMFL